MGTVQTHAAGATTEFHGRLHRLVGFHICVRDTLGIGADRKRRGLQVTISFLEVDHTAPVVADTVLQCHRCGFGGRSISRIAHASASDPPGRVGRFPH